MPFSLTSNALTRANFATPLKAFVDGLESTIGTVSTVASNALSTAGQKYAKPETGIPLADLATAVQSAIVGNALGTLSNPVKEAAAPRPTGLTHVVWDTPTDPTNRAAGDFNLQTGT